MTTRTCSITARTSPGSAAAVCIVSQSVENAADYCTDGPEKQGLWSFLSISMARYVGMRFCNQWQSHAPPVWNNSCVWGFHMILKRRIVKLPACLVSSVFSHPVPTPPNMSQQQNPLRRSGSLSPHLQLCCSSHKCIFLPDVAPFKKEHSRHFSS